MTKQALSPTHTKDRELTVSRLVNAPRELVFKVFTDPNHVVHWWGPRNFRNIVHEIDIRPGGVWRFDMEGWGQVFPNKIIYQEIIKPEKIVFIHGNDVADLENDPDTFQNEITFEAKGQKTLVTMKVIFKSAEVLRKNVEENHAIEGGNQTMDKLEEYLERVNVNTSER